MPCPSPALSHKANNFQPDSVAVGVEKEFEQWLAQRLIAERTAVVSQLQEQIAIALTIHREALLAEMTTVCRITAQQHKTVGEVSNSEGGLPSLFKVKSDGQEQKAASKEAAKNSLQSLHTRSLEVGTGTGVRKTRSHQVEALKKLASTTYVGDNNLKRFVVNNKFEAACLLVIALNTVMLAVETQHRGYMIGVQLNYPSFHKSSPWTWHGYDTLHSILSSVFAVLFLLELSLRIIAEGLRSMRHTTIMLDLLVTGTACLELFSSSGVLGVNPTVLRLVRLVHVARVLPFARTMRSFDSLFLLVRSLRASVTALLWSFLLLLLVQLSVGLCLSQALSGYLRDESKDLQTRQAIFRCFGTFTHTIVTMFEIAIGNWIPTCRLLMDNVNEWYGMFYVLYRCVFMFAVVNVIRAVFITETSRVAASDDKIAIMKKQRMQEEYAQKLATIFTELDDSGDGQVDWEEFSQILEDDVMKRYLGTMEIDTSDVALLFKLLDGGDGTISSQEFCQGILKLKGEAKSIDILVLRKMIRKLDTKFEIFAKHCLR